MTIPWAVHERRGGVYVVAPYFAKSGDNRRVAIAFSREHADAFAEAMNKDQVGIGATSANGAWRRGRKRGR